MQTFELNNYETVADKEMWRLVDICLLICNEGAMQTLLDMRNLLHHNF